MSANLHVYQRVNFQSNIINAKILIGKNEQFEFSFFNVSVRSQVFFIHSGLAKCPQTKRLNKPFYVHYQDF